MSKRQEFNFLTALVKQLDKAHDEGDDLVAHYREVHNNVMGEERTYGELVERIDVVEQWLARLESALEELESDWSASASEDDESLDDGDYDDDIAGDEPAMGSARPRHGRVAEAVAGAREGHGNRRPVTEVGRQTVRIGSGTKSKG